MDAFLPGVPGWELAYDSPNFWHFRFHGPTPEALVEGREKIYFAYFWNDLAADKRVPSLWLTVKLTSRHIPVPAACVQAGPTLPRGQAPPRTLPSWLKRN